MNTGIKIIACTALVAIALTMAVFTLADFSPGEDGYRLGEYQGRVAVFQNGAPEPLSITDIELGSLRRSDRDMIARGLQVADRDELLGILEDLGS